jgi:hypothetical protein
MFPFNPVCPLVVLLRLVSAGIEIHIFLFVIFAAAVDVLTRCRIFVDDVMEEFLGLAERVICGVASLNLVGCGEGSDRFASEGGRGEGEGGQYCEQKEDEESFN